MYIYIYIYTLTDALCFCIFLKQPSKRGTDVLSFCIFMKQPNRRVGMYCFQEYGDIHQLTHSHILLRIPIEHNTDHVIELMNEGFKALDDRQDKLFKVYKETADDVIGNAIYSSKKLKDNYKDSEFVVL